MPYIKIETNVPLNEDQRAETLRRTSAEVAELLGKPERWVMTRLDAGVDMLYGGLTDPLAYVELKSIGLPRERCKELSARICALLKEALGVEADRVYVEFADVDPHIFGWNGGTFR